MEKNQTDLFGDEIIHTVSKDLMNSGLEAMEDNSYVKYCEKHYALISELSDVGLPAKGQQMRLVTRQTFNAIQFIEYVAKKETIIDMKIAIYSINFNAAKILLNLIDSGKIKTVEILMSNLRNKAHRKKEEIIKNMFSTHPSIKLFFCSSHAKVFSCSTEKKNFYTMEGSGNMSYNSRIEQYVIDNDEKLYLFTCNWMGEIKKYLSGTKEFEDCTKK